VTIFDTEEQIEMQQECFNKFVGWLESQEGVISVLLADKEEEARGIDMWAVMKTSDPVPIQVKVDSRIAQTRNIAVEVVGKGRYRRSDFEKHEPGWLYLLNSTRRLVYIDFQSGGFKVYDSGEFYAYVVSHMKGWPAHTVLNGSKDGGIHWHGIVVCMKQHLVKHLEKGSGCINNAQSGVVSWA